MNLTRRDLLLEEKEKRPIDKQKIDNVINEGGAIQNMLDTYGWKIVYEGFIEPSIAESRFLGASREDLADIRAEIRVLKQMLKFIETRVKNANIMVEKIKKG
jgi:hypothetical protein